MKIGRNRRRGWVWTSQGSQKKPRRMRRVKSVPKPSRRRKRRVRRISTAVRKSATPVGAEAQQVAKERDGTDSALTAAPKPAPRSPRRVWSGKYDDLANLAKDEP
jgi:hypothetical protein